MKMENLADATMQALFAAQQAAFAADMSPPEAVRDDRLARIEALTADHGDEFADAISADFGHRSRHETQIAEVFVTLAAVRHARRHLRRWMKPRRMPTALHFRPGWSRILRQPLGVAGIVSPWNYPLQLALAPAVGALAAGNRVMLKPSELTPRFSGLLRDTVARRFAAEEMAVVTGDAEIGRQFCALPFDHLFFTGSTAVGRLVAEVAAKNLTPTTLELGGKSPAILDASCDIDAVATKLAVGKLLNAGQTCIAPDYILLVGEREAALESALSRAVARLFPTLAANPDYTSIVSDRHYARLRRLIDEAVAAGARAVPLNPAGEEFDPAARKLPPHLLFGVTEEMAVMQEEIFGPVLPVIRVPDLAAAIRYVNRHPRPLALYWFGNDSAACDQVLAQTIAGGVTINDTLWHIAQEELPFGGVGASGQGAYHGERGFLAFTKEKPVFFQPKWNGVSLFYPPYGPTFDRMLGVLKRLV